MNLPPLHSPLRAILPFCLALLLMATVAPASSPLLRYREQTGDASFLFSWQADTAQDGGTVIVTQRQGEETFRSVNTLEGITSSWQYTKVPDTDVRVERVGNQLHFQGRVAGEAIDKQEPIDERPWFQPLSYSLRCMVARQQQQASFWTVRPDTLEALALKAESDGSGPVPQTSGPAQSASRMVIRLDGLMSALWSAEYWFRQGDNLFVHYRGTHGPPGTAETVISLEQPQT